MLARDLHERAIRLPVAGNTLTVLVEDQGRVDYGPRLGEDKGLIGGVPGRRAVDRLDGDPAGRGPDPGPAAGPGPAARLRPGDQLCLLRPGAPADLFLDTTAWGKGLVWINGFALGRYWRRPPTETLYVPGPATRAGRNELVVLELEAMADSRVRFVEGLRLGHTEV